MRVFTVSESFGNSRVKLYGRVENIYRELMFLCFYPPYSYVILIYKTLPVA